MVAASEPYRTGGRRALVLGYAGRCRSGEQSCELAVGRRTMFDAGYRNWPACRRIRFTSPGRRDLRSPVPIPRPSWIMHPPEHEPSMPFMAPKKPALAVLIGCKVAVRSFGSRALTLYNHRHRGAIAQRARKYKEIDGKALG